MKNIQLTGKLTYYPNTAFADKLRQCCPKKFQLICRAIAQHLTNRLRLPVSVEIYGRQEGSCSYSKLLWSFEGSVRISTTEVAQLRYEYCKFDRKWKWSLDAGQGLLRMDGHPEKKVREAVVKIEQWIDQDYRDLLNGFYLILEAYGFKIRRWNPDQVSN